MADIEVTPLGGGTFRVRVVQGTGSTSHTVTVPPSLMEDLDVGEVVPERVVRESFAFLLEREPAGSILSEFSLDQIAQYFPEFEEELPRRLKG